MTAAVENLVVCRCWASKAVAATSVLVTLGHPVEGADSGPSVGPAAGWAAERRSVKRIFGGPSVFLAVRKRLCSRRACSPLIPVDRARHGELAGYTIRRQSRRLCRRERIETISCGEVLAMNQESTITP
jgi:hypothetical protein